MDTAQAAEHWDHAYSEGDRTRSWCQDEPVESMRMLDGCGVTPADSLVDVGGGASTLVDALIDRGFADVTVLDISAAGLRTAQDRLGTASGRVRWLVVDVLGWRPERTYRVWHDRAVLHFLTAEQDQQRYLETLSAATAPDALAVFGTFAPDGPQQCSGLPVARYSAGDLADLLGDRWTPVLDDREEHRTPADAIQPFVWAAFRRTS